MAQIGLPPTPSHRTSVKIKQKFIIPSCHWWNPITEKTNKTRRRNNSFAWDRNESFPKISQFNKKESFRQKHLVLGWLFHFSNVSRVFLIYFYDHRFDKRNEESPFGEFLELNFFLSFRGLVANRLAITRTERAHEWSEQLKIPCLTMNNSP